MAYKLLIKSALQNTKGQRILTCQRSNVQLSFRIFSSRCFLLARKALTTNDTYVVLINFDARTKEENIPLKLIDAVYMVEHLPKELAQSHRQGFKYEISIGFGSFIFHLNASLFAMWPDHLLFKE